MNFSAVDHRDVWLRAGKTFVQAVLASLVVSDGQLTKSTLMAALAAGFSAVWNYSKEIK